MFIKYIKELSVKKILKRNLHSVKPSSLVTPIQTIGVIVDESYFVEKEQLIQELVSCGIKENNMKMLVFRDKIKTGEKEYEYIDLKKMFAPWPFLWICVFSSLRIRR